jgi:DNA-binding MarR family transcriptional regulator
MFCQTWGMAPRLTQKERDVEAVMAASRALVAIVARSFEESEVPITLQQWRVLVIVSSFGPVSAGGLARWMEVHPSKATRMCDGLAKARLISRRQDPDDRRRTRLSLTSRGQKLVDELHGYRREAIAAILDQLPAASRHRLGTAMQEFADVAGDSPEQFVAGTTHRL